MPVEHPAHAVDGSDIDAKPQDHATMLARFEGSRRLAAARRS
jgi:hypothetical protein